MVVRRASCAVRIVAHPELARPQKMLVLQRRVFLGPLALVPLDRRRKPLDRGRKPLDPLRGLGGRGARHLAGGARERAAHGHERSPARRQRARVADPARLPLLRDFDGERRASRPPSEILRPGVRVG